MRGSRKFCQRGPTLTFLVDGGEGVSKYHYNRAIIDPPAKRHFDDDSIVNAGLVVL